MLLSYELAFKRQEEAWEVKLGCPPWGRLSWKQQEMLFFPPRVLSPWNYEAGSGQSRGCVRCSGECASVCVRVSQGLPVWVSVHASETPSANLWTWAAPPHACPLGLTASPPTSISELSSPPVGLGTGSHRRVDSLKHQAAELDSGSAYEARLRVQMAALEGEVAEEGTYEA